MKVLPGSTPAAAPVKTDRLDHLRNYLVACVRDNVLTAADLVSLSTLDKLRETFSADVKQMVREAGSGLLKLASFFVRGGG